MKRKLKYIGLKFSIIMVHSSRAQNNEFPFLKGPYLGQDPPGMTPEIFAPGIISTGYNERIAAFTPDGKEFYYSLYNQAPAIAAIGSWKKPQIVAIISNFVGKVPIAISPPLFHSQAKNQTISPETTAVMTPGPNLGRIAA